LFQTRTSDFLLWNVKEDMPDMCPYGGHHLGRKKIRNAQFTKNAPYESVLFNKVKKTV